MTLECHVCIYFSCIYDCCRIFFKLVLDLRIVRMLGTILQLFSSFLDMVKWRKLCYQLSFLAPSLPRLCSVDYEVYTESIYWSWIDHQNCTGLVRESRHRWGLNLDHSFDNSVHNLLSWGEWINDLPCQRIHCKFWRWSGTFGSLHTHTKCLEYMWFFFHSAIWRSSWKRGLALTLCSQGHGFKTQVAMSVSQVHFSRSLGIVT